MKKYFIILGSLQTFTAIGAIPAGILFLMDSSGRLMGMTPDFLADSPLRSFLLPGLFLLIVNGLTSAAGAYLSFSGNRFAGIAGLALGSMLCIWIAVQFAWLTETSFLQPLILIVGLLEILAGWRLARLGSKKVASSRAI